MTMRVSTWGQVSSGLVVSMLAACGGGGGGGGYGSTPLLPTINFSAPTAATTINFGQAMTVAWTSAYSTSCTASASNAAAGAFTGTQATSGSVTVVPTAPGSYTYTLSCTGTGGTQSTSTTVTVTPNLLAALAPTGTIVTVGSTVDPLNGDANPYGLTIAPATAGLITKGDLVVCNFNDGPAGTPPNAQGAGTTIIGLHPGATPAAPYRIAQSAALNGCNALTMLPDDSISASAWSSNLNPLVSAAGTVGAPFAADTFTQPWGEAFVAATGTQPAAIYVTNAPANNGVVAVGGTIDRISLDANNAQTSFTEILTGLCSGGSPGSIFGPAGLTYDVSSDTLYVVDSSSASVYAIAGVSSVPKDGIVANGQCSATTPTPVPTFSGPSMASIRVIAHGAPFVTPISSALLKNGDLVVGNGDIGVQAASATTNLLIEVSPVLPGGFVGQPVQVDTGAPGALFGLAATVSDQGNQIIYFNDDSASPNAVMQLGPVASTTTTPSPY
ncbi:MAG TPA: hypothetical protein VK794_12025 [Steroidobacteraceae bacterium]|jgi:hypothetical protein|nr:hypothetical protein [Steroidobacteraceae bacterium]